MTDTTKNKYATILDNFEPVTRVDFSIYSNIDVVKDSAISDPNGLTNAEIYNNGEPVEDGVIGTRLGVTESRLVCKTCGQTALTCPGHFGHIKLVQPVFHMGFRFLLKDILSCICIRCSKLLVYKNENEISKLLNNKQGKARFAEIKSICKGISHCQKENYGCGTPAHKITIEKKYGDVLFLAEAIKKKTDNDETGTAKKNAPQILSPQLCYDILRCISAEDCMIMGIDPEKSRPENMIITNFPVPPVQVRPSIKMELLSSSTIDDDLTHKLVDIIKNNENLRDAKGDGSLVQSASGHDDFTLLQYHVATFYANDIIGLPRSQQKNKKVTKSMSERLKGKDGRVRGNLMGKRVDMSGRSVITSDPNIAFNEVGIPLIIAKNLTYPEIATKNNIKYLQQLVNNGRKVYPGANCVIKNSVDLDGNESRRIFYLKYVEKPDKLELGDIVERHLINGDMVLFNRQPSLHKLSMMGHVCHIINDPTLMTFRVNVSVTEPYNADFDGDEMNIHVPQSIQTVTELRLICNAIKCFVSPATSKIAIVAKQDTLMGSKVQTRSDTLINWKDSMNIIMNTTLGIKNHLPKHKQIPGRFLYSEIIPPRINIEKKNEKGEYVLRIVNGLITDGTFGKSEISAIIQSIWFQYGSRETQKFIDNLQKMILQFLMRYGYTIGIKDTLVPKKVHLAVGKIIETARKNSQSARTEYENDPYVMTSEAFEANQQKTLEAVLMDVQKAIMARFDVNSGIYICISSGASGAEINAAQIIGCIGQVIVEGKRIQKRFNNRTLPTFAQYDDSAFARGFCHNSFMSGLNPMEFFFHVISGREGIINTAIKTADTGYVQRKLIKIMEDIKVEYDGTVRNANDKLIQCVYGDNGINTEKQMEQKIDLISSDNATIRSKYIYSDEEIDELKLVKNKGYTPDFNEKLYKKLVVMRDTLRTIQRKLSTSYAAFKESYMMPVNIQQLLINITNNPNRDNKKTVNPYYVMTQIKKMYSGSYSKILKYGDKSSIKKSDDKKIKLLFKIYLYDVLTPKKCTHLHHLSHEEFDGIVDHFKKIMLLAKVEGGEMVGFVGAQSIGEPVTQSNLKSFHKSGTGKATTDGLVRVKEILSVTKNIKMPTTEIILESKYKHDKITVNKIASYLKYTTLRDVVDTVNIYYDPNPFDKKSIASRDGVDRIFDESHGKTGCQTDISGLPWVIQLVLSKEKMIERNVTMLEIKTSFCSNWGSRYDDNKGAKKEYKKIIEKISQAAVVTNYDNSPVPIVHIRFDANNYNKNVLIQFMEMVVTKYKIKGYIGINESNYITEESYIEFDEDGVKQNKKQFVISTDGINLSEMAQVNGIDLLETKCNDIVAIYETYGVEAARSAYIIEFTKAIESSGNGFSNYQHVELLADAVTHMGYLIAVNRHGANKLDTDPFSRASFEKTVEQLLAAATFGESDHIRSVSARIMVGALINGGTGCFDLQLDCDKVKRTLKPKEIITENTLVKKTAVSDLIRKKKQKVTN